MNRIVIILFSIISIQKLYAQELKPTRDLRIWAGLAIEKKLHKDFKLEVEQQVRTFHNSSQLDEYFLNVGVRYSLNSHFRLGGSIRYIYERKRTGVTENNYRYSLDIEFRKNISSKVKLIYRLRYQKEYVNLFIDYSDNKIYYSAIRNKLTCYYKFNKAHNIYAAAELFRLMETFKRPYFSKIRFEAGDDSDTRIGKLNYSIGIEKELNTEYPYSFYFLKIIYTIE